MGKIILDLCGGTGAWSRPYKEAGYDVRVITLPANDVRDYIPPMEVYGVLAAPPCTMFSLARSRAIKPRDLREGMETVNACLKIIHECQYGFTPLKFWALENPQGKLRRFLGAPAMTFHPWHFGDKISKKTDLWGIFNTDLIETPTPLTPLEFSFQQSQMQLTYLPEVPAEYVRPPGVREITVRRAITPSGFANAFFEANR